MECVRFGFSIIKTFIRNMYSFYNKEENKNLKVLEGSFVCLQTKLIFK